MFIQANKVDADGFIIEPVSVLSTDVLEADIITKPVTGLLYKPKWTGSEWIEGATQEYIDSWNKPEEPTELELVKEEQKMTSLAVLELAEMILGG